MALEKLGGSQGPDVVLVPGLHGSPSVFQPLVQRLQSDFRLWGFQCSEGGIGEDCQLLSRRLDERGLSKPRLVTGSYGGQVALALEHPVHSLVLTGSFPLWRAVPLQQRGFLRLAMRFPERVLEKRYAASFCDRLVEDGVPLETARSIAPPSGRALRRRLQSLIGRRGLARGRRVIWIAGQDDLQAPWPEAELQVFWPEAVVRRVSGKHRPYASDPDEFAAVLRREWALIDPGDK